MEQANISRWSQGVVVLSLALLFFTIPHTLEDFATGAPEEAGISAGLLSLVISFIFFIQALGLYWLGQKKRKGLFVHIALGLFWPIASGMAQLPGIVSGDPYRDGWVSKGYVFGMILIGILMLLASVRALILKKS
jgi:hypothetical protein